MLVQAIDEVRHRAGACLEEGYLYLRMLLEYTLPKTSAVIAVIWSKGKLMQCTCY